MKHKSQNGTFLSMHRFTLPEQLFAMIASLTSFISSTKNQTYSPAEIYQASPLLGPALAELQRTLQ